MSLGGDRGRTRLTPADDFAEDYVDRTPVRRSRSSPLAAFPLLLIPILLYNVIVFIAPGHDLMRPLFSVTMVSGGVLSVASGDLLIIFALIMLFLEVVKATRTGTKSIIDHMLSTVVFVGALIEFLLVGRAATSVFLLLLAICLIDIIAGYSVSIRVAQRDYTVERVDA